ncbi:hypothetical protein [Flagellimonas baculiformis]|uniref:hypothetical protein n=1 Tax=Flagellimonas baculiformis TaxID=3067310 RepID=UPI00296ECE6C|nr:hypothetical protein [Muricauda sp. D6]
MAELIRKYFHREVNDKPYRPIADKIYNSIDISKLPIYGEKEIRKLTSDRYGKVKIKLDIERDVNLKTELSGRNRTINFFNDSDSLDEKIKKHNSFTYKSFFTYSWEANDKCLPKSYCEPIIKPEIEDFIQLLYTYNQSTDLILRFSVVDGEFRSHERPYHGPCVKFALVEIFNQL